MIRFVLNGEKTEYDGSPARSLLEVLRDIFLLTSVKCGCREGECGACAVLIDGVLKNSCCVAVGSVCGSEITTLEGYRKTERFRVLSDAFADYSAVQCGFCTPGMVLASEALLSRNPQPSTEEIREGLSGNICRRMGYNAIVNAVAKAAKEGRGLW